MHAAASRSRRGAVTTSPQQEDRQRDQHRDDSQKQECPEQYGTHHHPPCVMLDIMPGGQQVYGVPAPPAPGVPCAIPPSLPMPPTAPPPLGIVATPPSIIRNCVISGSRPSGLRRFLSGRNRDRKCDQQNHSCHCFFHHRPPSGGLGTASQRKTRTGAKC